MRAVVTGAVGQLGRALLATAPPQLEIVSVGRAECDITDPSALERVLEASRPDVVVNTAAYTAVDAAETHRDEAFAVNATGAENVARAATAVGARLIQISTDYVFDGDRSTPYPPGAATNPLNVYGASKLEGERLALGADPSAVIIRSGWVYSQHGKNFLLTVLRLLGASRPLRVVRDQVGGPTSATRLASAIWKTAAKDLFGTYHWADAGSASWYDFAVEIGTVARQLGLMREIPEIVGITSEEYGSPARRPAYSVLDSSELAGAIGTSPVDWRQALFEELARESAGSRDRR